MCVCEREKDPALQLNTCVVSRDLAVKHKARHMSSCSATNTRFWSSAVMEKVALTRGINGVQWFRKMTACQPTSPEIFSTGSWMETAVACWLPDSRYYLQPGPLFRKRHHTPKFPVVSTAPPRWFRFKLVMSRFRHFHRHNFLSKNRSCTTITMNPLSNRSD